MRSSTTLTNGHTLETNNAYEAQNFTHYTTGQTFMLFGKPVGSEDFYAAVRDAVQAAWDKKAKTHKRVRVLHGSSVAGYVEKWVRK